MFFVGVGYPDSANANTRRTMDLTPSPNGDPSSRLPSGGAPAFLETLRRDVIPLIEKSYHARSDRALMGHSYGGLFTLYALYTAPELFHRYGIFSPATWWDRHRLLDQISNGGEPRAPAAVRVFVTVGVDEDKGMRAEADSVSAILTRVYGAKLTLESRRFAGNHMSYFPEAVSSGLPLLYRAPGCYESLSTVSGRLSTVLSVPEGVVIERFVRNGSEVWGRAFQTGGACFSYQLTVDANERVTAARLEQSLGVPRTASGEVDASHVRLQTTAPAAEHFFQVSGPTALYVPMFVAPLDQLVRMAPSRVGDSTRVLLANFRRADTSTMVVTRISPDSIRVGHPRFEVRVHVSEKLDIIGGTTTLTGSPASKWLLVRQR
jgi:pimeloyl-ACP methyl ester carboxylesterase